MYAEELACIVHISENVLADASIDIFGQVRPLIQQEFYAYKIGKLVDDKTDFATAAEGYFKDHPTKNKGHVEVSVPGSSASNTAKDANKAINDAIRKAGGFTV